MPVQTLLPDLDFVCYDQSHWVTQLGRWGTNVLRFLTHPWYGTLFEATEIYQWSHGPKLYITHYDYIMQHQNEFTSQSNRSVLCCLSADFDAQMISDEFQQITCDIGWVNISDCTQTNVLQYFAPVYFWIEQQVQAHRSVYIHCRYGQSRSYCMAIAYLMQKWAISHPLSVLAYVRDKRPCEKINSGFLQQLILLGQHMEQVITPQTPPQQTTQQTPPQIPQTPPQQTTQQTPPQIPQTPGSTKTHKSTHWAQQMQHNRQQFADMSALEIIDPWEKYIYMYRTWFLR